MLYQNIAPKNDEEKLRLFLQFTDNNRMNTFFGKISIIIINGIGTMPNVLMNRINEIITIGIQLYV